MHDLDRRELAAIFAGGAAGALLRVGLTRAFGDAPPAWPWTIFLINLGAAFALGAIAERLGATPGMTRHRAALLGTGFCGALSTFSTLALEIVGMLDAGAIGRAALYAAASVLGGLAAIVFAGVVMRALDARRAT